jgi:signal transduction histidine kinase
VLDNLLSNAIKYSPGGGTVLIELAQRHDRNIRWALVRVHDEGVGVPADYLPQLFRWFARADNVRPIVPGTGFGLAGVRQTVMQHGGVVTVRSREGAGSIFAFCLPMQPLAVDDDAALPRWERLLSDE